MEHVSPRAGGIPGIALASVHYDSGGYAVPGYLARPLAPGPHPAVIIGQEAMGIADYIRDVAAKLAAEGYVALVPDYRARVLQPGLPLVQRSRLTRGLAGCARLPRPTPEGIEISVFPERHAPDTSCLAHI
ncbi:MAG: hypothetical protein EXR43_03905 [Dehalococcoidia bacterium]|nr:hypothetical protein [Dehalococcoidia bacterium]